MVEPITLVGSYVYQGVWHCVVAAQIPVLSQVVCAGFVILQMYCLRQCGEAHPRKVFRGYLAYEIFAVFIIVITSAIAGDMWAAQK